MTARTRLVSVAAATAAVTVLGAAATGAITPAAAAPTQRATAVDDARANVRSHADRLGVTSTQGLQARDVVLDQDGSAHVRFDRTYRGLPVLGGDLVVHQGAAGAYRGADRASTATIKLASMAPTVSSAAAAASAAGVLRSEGAEGVSADGATLKVDATGDPRLVWEAVATGTRPDQTPAELHSVVDARSGAVLRSWDGIEHAATAGTGNGFFVGTVGLTVDSVSGGYALRDPSRGSQYTIDMGNRQGGKGTLVTSPDTIFGNGLLSDRQTVAVDAQFGTAKTWDYYQTVHGRNGIANDGKGAYNQVHYGRNYNNAFWSDSCFCMTYGDGDGTTFNPFDSLDVAGHEMTHGVTSRSANLAYSGESGGLNEATSDIFGTSVEFYANNPNDVPDYLIGEELYKAGGGKALRYMDKPSKDGKSPDCYSSSVGSLDVHYSSAIANHFFYLASEGSGAKTVNGVSYNSPTCNGSTVTGIGQAAVQKVWYRALTVYMTSSTSYAGARTATLKAATDLYGAGSTQYNGVAAAWSAVAVG